MSLSAKRILEHEGPGEYIEPKCAGNDTYYHGAILAFDSNGYVAPPTDAAAIYGAGIYDGKAEDGVDDYAYAVASGSHPRLRIRRGKTWIPFSGAVQSDCGELVYLADDETVTQTAGSKTIAYTVLDFKTGYVLIDFRNPIKVS